MKACVFGIALLAAVSLAEDVDPPSDFENKCMQCVDEGYMFCSVDGINGKCHDVSCEEDSLTGDEKLAAYGKCTLRETGLCTGLNEKQMLHYKQCSYSSPANCPATVTITNS